MHICFGNLTIIGSDNGLSPGRQQAIIWTKAGILLIGPLGTNLSEIALKVSSAKLQPFCLGLNVLNCVAPMQFTVQVHGGVTYDIIETHYACLKCTHRSAHLECTCERIGRKDPDYILKSNKMFGGSIDSQPGHLNSWGSAIFCNRHLIY